MAQFNASNIKGPKGDAGTINIGTVTTGTPVDVTNSGTPESAILNFVLPQGDAGTVTVGNTIQLSSGQAADVVNVGTPQAAILDFYIPLGPQGDPGADGTGAVETFIADWNALPSTDKDADILYLIKDLPGVTTVKGDKGDKGDQGDIGPTGPQGLRGLQGNPGPAGPPIDLNLRGIWSPYILDYQYKDVVNFTDSTGRTNSYYYNDQANPNRGEDPGDPNGPWELFVMQGAPGPEGPEGPVGPMGPQGQNGQDFTPQTTQQIVNLEKLIEGDSVTEPELGVKGILAVLNGGTGMDTEPKAYNNLGGRMWARYISSCDYIKIDCSRNFSYGDSIIIYSGGEGYEVIYLSNNLSEVLTKVAGTMNYKFYRAGYSSLIIQHPALPHSRVSVIFNNSSAGITEIAGITAAQYAALSPVPVLLGLNDRSLKVNDAKITIKQNGSILDDFTLNQASDKTIDLGTTANDATITLKQNGANIDSFTVNQATNKTIDLGTTANDATISIKQNGNIVDTFTVNQAANKIIDLGTTAANATITLKAGANVIDDFTVNQSIDKDIILGTMADKNDVSSDGKFLRKQTTVQTTITDPNDPDYGNTIDSTTVDWEQTDPIEKVPSATAGNIAIFDSQGNVIDSGKVPTAGAQFRGSFATEADLPAILSNWNDGDYCTVQADSTQSGNTVQYRIENGVWVIDYVINISGKMNLVSGTIVNNSIALLDTNGQAVDSGVQFPIPVAKGGTGGTDNRTANQKLGNWFFKHLVTDTTAWVTLHYNTTGTPPVNYPPVVEFLYPNGTWSRWYPSYANLYHIEGSTQYPMDCGRGSNNARFCMRGPTGNVYNGDFGRIPAWTVITVYYNPNGGFTPSMTNDSQSTFNGYGKTAGMPVLNASENMPDIVIPTYWGTTSEYLDVQSLNGDIHSGDILELNGWGNGNYCKLKLRASDQNGISYELLEGSYIPSIWRVSGNVRRMIVKLNGADTLVDAAGQITYSGAFGNGNGRYVKMPFSNYRGRLLLIDQATKDALTLVEVTCIDSRPVSIPANDSTITLTKNGGTSIGSFTLNQDTDQTIDLGTLGSTSKITIKAGGVEKGNFLLNEPADKTIDLGATANDATITLKKGAVNIGSFTVNASANKDIDFGPVLAGLTADYLTTPRTIQTNLASTTAVPFDGTADIVPGITGILPIANGGHGADTAIQGYLNLGGRVFTNYSSNPAYIKVTCSGAWGDRDWMVISNGANYAIVFMRDSLNNPMRLVLGSQVPKFWKIDANNFLFQVSGDANFTYSGITVFRINAASTVTFSTATASSGTAMTVTDTRPQVLAGYWG